MPEEQVKKRDDEEKSFTQFNVADDASMEYYFASDARCGKLSNFLLECLSVQKGVLLFSLLLFFLTVFMIENMW